MSEKKEILEVPRVYPLVHPVTDLSKPGGVGVSVESGITLLEYFAAHAPEMPSGYDNEILLPVEVSSRFDRLFYALIEWRWNYAYAMLGKWQRIMDENKASLSVIPSKNSGIIQ